jgi:hypothetical protein
LVGEDFPVLAEFDTEYLTLQKPAEAYNGYQFKNYVLKEDAEIYDE